MPNCRINHLLPIPLFLFAILISFSVLVSVSHSFSVQLCCLLSIQHHYAWGTADWHICSKGSQSDAVRCPVDSAYIFLMTHIQMAACHKTLNCHVSVTWADILSNVLVISKRIYSVFAEALRILQKLDGFCGFT